MENIRHKMQHNDYYKLQPLGRSKPIRGQVSEDLGCTEFKTRSTTEGRKSFKRPQANPPDDDESDGKTTSEDDLTEPLIFFTNSVDSIQKIQDSEEDHAVSHVTPPCPRSKVKPHPNFRGAEPPHNEGHERNSSPQRPLRLSNSSLKGDSMPPSNQLALQLPQKSFFRENSQGASPLEELNPNRAKRPKTCKGKCEPEHFPIQEDCGATKSDLKRRSPDRVRRDAAPFPVTIGIPSRSPCKRLQSGLSATSPSRPQDLHGKENTNRVFQRFPLDTPSAHPPQCALSDEDDENDELALTDSDSNAILAYGGPRPFPMAISQCLPESTHRASGPKRSAINNNDQKANKRPRSSPEPDTFDVFTSLSIEGDSHVNQASICPYCDEPWPSSPSPTLLSLLECTKRKSYTDPRPGNALGLKAPLAAFVELCQRHRFEMTHLPLALERGWPTRLDFAGLPSRIKSFRKKLRRFIDQPHKSQFWREVRDDIKEVGRMKVVSVSGQYATFERTQPGYYGEQGSIIIHQTLYSLFPPDDIPLSFVDPLTSDQFLTRVLVPEAAVLLIQDDMCLPTKEEALLVLDESKKYGVAMFPEQAQGEEAAEVGEQLARERAKERRKLLEERGEADADVQRQVERERRLARKAKDKDQPAAKGKRKAKESESDTGPIGDEEGELGLASDFNEPIVKTESMRLEQGGGVSLSAGPGQLTPRPLKKQIREISIISWRSKRSPSTSPVTRPPKPTTQSSSSIYKSSYGPISSLSKLPTQDYHQDSQWIFDLRNVSPSPDHEDVGFEVLAGNKSNPKAGGESDSDVVVMNDDPTPKPRSKLKPHRIVQRINNAEAIGHKPTPILDAVLNQKVEKRHNQTLRVVLGQTKRKKKGTSKDKLTTSSGSGYTWLLDDLSE